MLKTFLNACLGDHAWQVASPDSTNYSYCYGVNFVFCSDKVWSFQVYV